MSLVSRFLLALVCAAAAALPLAANPAGAIEFRRLEIPDDVPAHLCTALAQDARGFIWMGTQGGLVRFDGYDFRVFRSNPRDGKTIGGSYVRSLLAARDGSVWAGAFSGGVSHFDPATDTFTRYRHNPKNPATLVHDRVEALVEDANGRVWMATDEGVDRLDLRTGRFDHFLRGQRSRALLIDGENVWAGTSTGLYVSHGDAGPFTPVADFATQFVSRLYRDSRGRIWVGTSDSRSGVIDANGRLLHRFERGTLSHFTASGFAEVGSEVWISTFGSGIDVIDGDSYMLTAHLAYDGALDDTINADRIGAMMRDRSGVVWVGTWGQGIARHDPATRAFRAIRNSPNQPLGLSHPAAVRALELHDGTIWVGTNGNGIDILDHDGYRIGEHRPNPPDPGALADGSITCLAQSADGTVWVATLDGTLHRMRPNAKRFERLAWPGVTHLVIHAMEFAPDGALWFGAEDGLGRVDARTSQITMFRHDANPHSLSGNAAESIAFTRDGRMWVGTNDGLNVFDPKRGTAVVIRRDAARRDTLPDNWVPDLLVDSHGRLWAATNGGACVLTSFDGATATFENVSEKLHRPPGPVESVIEDAQGFVWLSPRLRVDPRTWTAQELGPADGLSFRNFFIASRERMRDGELLFGSPEGLMIVQPSHIARWQYEPPVVISSMRINSESRGGATALRALRVEPWMRGFRIDFASLDFTASQRIHYRYRLDGYDSDWTATDATQRSLTYTRLPPGSYTLRVQGTNRAGVWSPHELRVPITVVPAFHQTIWFALLVIVLLAALIYLGYRLRVRQLEARSRELEATVAARTAELAEAYARIDDASLTDPLTSLRNRRFLEKVIGPDLELVARRDGPESDLVFLLVDLDHFKSVNDAYGHAAGDAVLVQTAAILKATFRASDYVIRWGGEEFLVIARFVDRRDGARLAEKLRASIAAHEFRIGDGVILERTCSIGFAPYPFVPEERQPSDWHEVVDIADSALYAAKKSGRNTWVGVEPATRDAAQAFRENAAAAVEARAVHVESPLASLRWT